MIPYKTLFKIDRKAKQPIYIQLTNQFIELIKTGVIMPNSKLPSSRLLSQLLSVHRKTVVACYEELELQGWITPIAQKGTFVNSKLPILKQKDFGNGKNTFSRTEAGFSFKKDSILNRSFPQDFDSDYMYVNDGISDGRLAPIKELGLIYRNIVHRKTTVQHLAYGTTYGNRSLRTTLVDYLNNTRGLHITIDQIIITRGSQMGMYLASQLLFSNHDYVIIGETNYSSSDTTFENAGAQVLRVSVDASGLVVSEIENLCKKYNIKAVYTTSHHHHPTTVTMSAERRLHLLNLARTFEFAIIEDDYDYDFHYNQAPILPLASHDTGNNVIYIGSVCKTVAPVFRVGYLIASKEFVDECAKLRRFIDRQGDALLEMTFSEFIKNGSLDRHIKKSIKNYRARRDLFCKLLKQELKEYVSFDTPKGGMAVWLKLNKRFSWEEVSLEALRQKLVITEWQRYDMAKLNHNAIRVGFAAYDEVEIVEFVKRLKTTMVILNGKKRKVDYLE